MPAPNRYDIEQVDVGNYFDAFRQGRTDRLAAEGETRNRALSEYLPGALEGDEGARKAAMAATAGDPNMTIQLSQALQAGDQQKLAKAREMNGKIASLAAWADTPDKWAIANAEAKKLDPSVGDIPFEQRGAVIAKAQTVSEQLDQVWKQKSYDLDASRTRAANAASYASAEASRANATRAAGGGAAPAPSGYQWVKGEGGTMSLAPITGGPADANRVMPGEGAKVRASNAQLDALEQSLNSYLSDLDKTSSIGRIVSRGPEVSKVETGHTDLLMQMKNLYELGVLNGPDYMLMTKIVEDPTSFIQLARGTEGLKAQTDTVKSIITRSRNINNAKMGLPPSTTAPKPPGGDAGSSGTPIVKTQAEFDALPSGAMYVEPDGKRYRKP